MRLIILGVLTLAAFVYSQETCQSSDEEPYLLFGTKTAYTFASMGIPLNKAYDVPGCQPLAIWLLVRHGSHNPEAKEIPNLQKLTDFKNNIITNYKNGNFRDTNMRMCTSDVNLLDRWQWNPRQNLTFAGDLTSDGYISTQQLAQAWKQKFPGLLTDNFHDYVFKYINDQRSSTTFRAFTEGLFRAQEDPAVTKQSDEKLLQPYKYCQSWIKNVAENNETLDQLRIFESKQEYKEMISNISKRLGFNYDIQAEMIHYMYDMCRYNKAWDITQISPWCAVFSKQDLKRLEYAEDLEMYYRYGYGSPMNRQIGCTGIKDMMDFFKIHVDHNSPQQPRASVTLAESPALLLALGALGARRDRATLTADNFHSAAVQARRWTTSTISPYNANLAAVLYKCKPDNNFRIDDPYHVLFLENERPLNLEECNVGLCNYTFVKNRFGLIANNCNLEFCNSANKIYGVGLSFVLFLVLKLF